MVEPIAADATRILLAARAPVKSPPPAPTMSRNRARGEANEIKPKRQTLAFGRTHETEDAGLWREADDGTVRRVVDSVDDPIRRDP